MQKLIRESGTYTIKKCIFKKWNLSWINSIKGKFDCLWDEFVPKVPKLIVMLNYQFFKKANRKWAVKYFIPHI